MQLVRACAELPSAKIVTEKILCSMCNDKVILMYSLLTRDVMSTEWGICTLALLI